MISVLVFTESRFPIDRKNLKEFVKNHLQDRLTGQVEVSVSIVGDRKMKSLNAKYRQLPETTDVLSFPISDSGTNLDFTSGFSPEKSSPDNVLRLGDVVISYPQAVLEAAQENKLVNDQVKFLLAHGLDHLMGIHHE